MTAVSAVDVAGEPRVVRGGLLGLPQLDAHVAGQVLGGGEQLERVLAVGARIRVGSSNTSSPRPARAVSRSTPSRPAITSRSTRPCWSRQIARASAGVSAPSARCAAGDDPLGEDVGLVRGLGAGVEVLQGVDQRRVRVVPEPALRRAGCAPSGARRCPGRPGRCGAW